MDENQVEWTDIAIEWAKTVAFWLFWLLFYIICDFELTLLCLLMLVARNTGKNEKN